jgi:hypothetical protein
MKTFTEFPGMNLKSAAKTRQDLITGGKTAEELPQALGEALKLEGNKLICLMNALELVDTKFENLKRVIVSIPNEGEKPPEGIFQKGEHFYLVEYYPSLDKKPARDSQDQSGKGDRQGKRGKGGRGKRDDRGQKSARPGSSEKEGGRPFPPRRSPSPPQKQSPEGKPVITPKSEIKS